MSFFKELEDRVLKENPKKIRQKGLKKSEIPKTVEEFVEKFLSDYSKKYDSIYLNRKSQCSKGKRRSLGEIFMICRYYYPTCTLKQVFKALHKLVETKRGYVTSWCRQTERRMWYYAKGRENYVYNTGRIEEYGYTFGEYCRNLN